MPEAQPLAQFNGQQVVPCATLFTDGTTIFLIPIEAADAFRIYSVDKQNTPIVFGVREDGSGYAQVNNELVVTAPQEPVVLPEIDADNQPDVLRLIRQILIDRGLALAHAPE